MNIYNIIYWEQSNFYRTKGFKLKVNMFLYNNKLSIEKVNFLSVHRTCNIKK